MSDQAPATIEDFAARLAEAETPQPPEEAQPETEANEGEPAEQLEEVEGEPEAPVEEEGEQPEPESLDDKVVSWETASGDKFEVPVAELKNGYMREQDYRHKTQNLAQEREQASQAIQQQFQSIEQYKQELGVLTAIDVQIQSLEAAVQNTDPDSDPVGYMKAFTHIQQLKDHRNGVATRVQEVEQQRSAQSQAQLLQAQQRMVQELSTALPNFGPELVNKLNATGQEYGFTPQDLQTVTDPRFVKVLHDAMQFKAMQAKAPAAVNKVKAAPVKPTKQATSSPPTAIEQHAKRFAAKKDKNSFAALYAQTL